MKRAVEWHEQCLANMQRTLRMYEEADARSLARTEGLRAGVELYERQIAEARQRGMAEFDSERLLRKRRA